LLLVGAFSCGEEFDEHEDPTVDEIVQTGKEYLMANQGAPAAEAFNAARDRHADSTDANFGLVLAHTMQFMNLVDEIVSLAGALFLELPPEPITTDSEAIVMEQELLLGDYIQIYLSDTLEKDFADTESIFFAMEPGPDFLFTIPYYQIIIGDEALVSLEGEFDKTELYLFGGVSSLMNALIDILQAHYLNFDLNAIALPETEEGDTIGMILGILDLVEGLLTDPAYPEFLTVKSDGGFDRMKSAGVNLGNAFDRIATMFDQLATETDDQSNDQVRYLDKEKNNRYDQQIDPVQISTLVTIPPNLVPVIQQLCQDLAYAFWEGSTVDPHPYTVDKITLGMFNDLLVQLGVIQRPLLPEWLGIDVGSFFSDPTDEGLRTLLETVIKAVDYVIAIIEDPDGAIGTL
jgi:hypothetical protein